MKMQILGFAAAAALTGCVAIEATDTNFNTPLRHVGSQALGGVTLPFSKAVISGNTIYLSGEVAIDPATDQIVPGGTGPETTQIFANIARTLDGLDADLSDIVKCTVFLADMSTYGEMNTAYNAALPDPKPARATVAVSALAAGASLEIDCIAVKS
jgi:2-iminobutanoate/2-iminopropanoate deaminase